MEKQNHPQLELFSQGQKHTSGIQRSHPFFSYIRLYEKAILTIVAFMITAIISFSLGVERGKSIALLDNGYRMDTAAIKKPVQPSPTKQVATYTPAPIVPVQKELIQTQKAPQYLQNYTIQIASYQNNAQAQKEAEKFKKKGYMAVVITKGKYAVVCIGRFSTKENANSLLSELKKNKSYRDSFIRRL